jgi:hypothetical protein
LVVQEPVRVTDTIIRVRTTTGTTAVGLHAVLAAAHFGDLIDLPGMRPHGRARAGRRPTNTGEETDGRRAPSPEQDGTGDSVRAPFRREAGPAATDRCGFWGWSAAGVVKPWLRFQIEASAVRLSVPPDAAIADPAPGLMLDSGALLRERQGTTEQGPGRTRTHWMRS